jgi:hypothetical protein
MNELELELKLSPRKKMLSFYNMVQANKNLHKYYLDQRGDENAHILGSYIPFYAEIESISLKKESIFHQLKNFKTNIYYDKLWEEICTRMEWAELNVQQAMVVELPDETQMPSVKLPDLETPVAINFNG